MMMKLLIKELKLAAHPTLFVFMSMGFLLFIPNYPYSVVLMFGCLALFITLMYGRETKDIYFSSLLPIKRSDVVKGKVLLACFVQIGELIVGLLIAVIKVTTKMELNTIGLNPNIAYFGFGLILFSLFNMILFSVFFKTTVKAGKAFILAMIPVVILMILMESIAHFPTLVWINSFTGTDLLKQLPILLTGIFFYPLGIIISVKFGVRNFKTVDL